MNGYVFPERLRLPCVGGPADGHSAWVKACDHKATIYMRKHTRGFVYSVEPLWATGCAVYARENINTHLDGPVEWAMTYRYTT